MIEKMNLSNRRARFDYELLDTFEAGISLTGSEVKSLRNHQGSIAEAYARVKGGEVFLENMTIPIYNEASYNNHEPLRSRKLLLNKREIETIEAGLVDDEPIKQKWDTSGERPRNKFKLNERGLSVARQALRNYHEGKVEKLRPSGVASRGLYLKICLQNAIKRDLSPHLPSTASINFGATEVAANVVSKRCLAAAL